MQERKITPARESLFMARYAKKDGEGELSARNILQAAQQDLRSRQRNARIRHERKEATKEGLDSKSIGPLLHYAFVPKHVNKAKSAADLIEIASKELSLGNKSDKVNTYRIYSDPARLQEALVLARDSESAKA